MKLEEVPGKDEIETLKVLTEEELADVALADLIYALGELQRTDSKERPNLAVIDEYRVKVIFLL